jgi:multidrug resistance efflux pump
MEFNESETKKEETATIEEFEKAINDQKLIRRLAQVERSHQKRFGSKEDYEAATEAFKAADKAYQEAKDAKSEFVNAEKEPLTKKVKAALAVGGTGLLIAVGIGVRAILKSEPA